MNVDPVFVASTLEFATYVAKFIAKLDAEIKHRRSERAKHLLDEVNAIAADFGQDARTLAATYVEPEVQDLNPANRRRNTAHRYPVRQLLERELESSPHAEWDGSRVMFILADAGMGKTSLLLMLKLLDLAGKFTRKHEVRLHKIGRDTTSVLQDMKGRLNTILLLDSLDEDPLAWGRVEERIGDLLRAAQGSYYVIITCRTQFLPHSLEHEECIDAAGFRCERRYLSPFSDAQVQLFIRRSFPFTVKDHLRASAEELFKLFGFRPWKHPHRSIVRKTTSNLDDVRARPFVLRHAVRLARDGHGYSSRYALFEAIIDEWLRREIRKAHVSATYEELYAMVRLLALHIAASATGDGDGDGRTISDRELTALSWLVRGDAAEVGELVSADDKDRHTHTVLTRSASGRLMFAHSLLQEFCILRQLRTAPRGYEKWYPLVRISAEMLRMCSNEALPLRRFTGLAERELFEIAASQNHDWTRVQLEGADLSGLSFELFPPNLTEANLRGAKLTGTEIWATQLRGATIATANLDKAHLVGPNLRDANLSSAKLRHAVLLGVCLDGAVLRGADLRYAVIGLADPWTDSPGGQEVLSTVLSDIDAVDSEAAVDPMKVIVAARLHQGRPAGHDQVFGRRMDGPMPNDLEDKLAAAMHMIEAMATAPKSTPTPGGHARATKWLPAVWVHLAKAIFSPTSLRGADLSSAVLAFANLQCVNLADAMLSGADLSGGRLRKATLARAHLVDATLAKADLTLANLSGADLTRANLAGSDLTGADLGQAKLGQANLAGCNLGSARLSGADLTGANLYQAVLTGADLTGADLTGAILIGANLSDEQRSSAIVGANNWTDADDY